MTRFCNHCIILHRLSATAKGNFLCHGYLRNTNTKETFTDIDKQVVISEAGRKIWEAITTGKALEDPSLLTPFILLTFAVFYHFLIYFTIF
jgi:Ubiquitin-like modifier-activating enzyme ATG7 N-terminus